MKYYRLSYNALNEKVTGTQFQCITGYFGDMQNDDLPFEGKIDFDFDLHLQLIIIYYLYLLLVSVRLGVI